MALSCDNWEVLLISLPPSIRNVAGSLRKLCERIKTLSIQSVLHPRKCRCLAHSYSLLVRHVITLIGDEVSFYRESRVCELLTVLLHSLQEGERCVQDCTYPGRKWFKIGSARKQYERKWLINKGLAIALSTEICDVHLHDLVWCISTLISVLADYGDAGLDVKIQANTVHALLKETWDFADIEEHDVKSMQELFHKMGSNGHEQICNLICQRLSQSTCKDKLNLTNAVVPAYLWMDPQGFENMKLLGSNEAIVVFETRFMGGRFACKHFYRPGYEEVFANEAILQAGLQHANVAHMVCCTIGGSEDNTCRLVMELMHQDLGSLISKRRLAAGMDAPFSLLVGVDLMLQIAKGMEYLHQLGIMHRDLKSFNILVSHSQHASYLNEGGHVTAKIADFGTSKVSRQDTSMYTTKRVGTSIWRAPEVVDDEDETKYTKKADVYSFAIVCSEILTGLPPDELLPCDLRSELAKVLKEGRRPKLPSSCPLAISSYIEKCWHGDASQRPTFKQICAMFRFFKACILLRETEMLASPLQDDMFDFEELQRNAAERQFEGMFYHPVLDIPSEMHAFRLIWEQNFYEGVPMQIILSRILQSSAEVIGKGSLGSAFKCELEDGSIVAVRRFKKEFNAAIKLVDMVKLKHENLVPLLAHYHTKHEDLLVSEYMTNGSCLSDLLHGGNIILDWDSKLQVALDVAFGIDYLHDHGYTHGHIKSSNILLIDNYNRCVLSDYGIAQLVRRTAANEEYGAPELLITKKADVYSYGILLLDLLDGKNVRVKESLVQIALACIVPNPVQRPAMKQVLQMVEGLKKIRE